jgi:hypothetical protein
MSILNRLTALAACTALLHCAPDRMAGGAGAGNPPLAEVSLSLKAGSADPTSFAKPATSVLRNPDGTFTIQDSSGADFTLTGIEARLKGFDFNLPESLSCAGVTVLPCREGELSLLGPFTVDLMTGKSVPSLDLFKVPAGVYVKISLNLIAQDPPEGSTAEDTTRNLILTGRLGAAGQGGQAFEMALNLRDGLDFSDPLGLRLGADSLNTVRLLLSVDGWFRDVDAAACVTSAARDSTGTVRLGGDDFCGGAGLKIRNSIEASGEVDHKESSAGP